jgi:hypothetical protein
VHLVVRGHRDRFDHRRSVEALVIHLLQILQMPVTAADPQVAAELHKIGGYLKSIDITLLFILGIKALEILVGLGKR